MHGGADASIDTQQDIGIFTLTRCIGIVTKKLLVATYGKHTPSHPMNLNENMLVIPYFIVRLQQTVRRAMSGDVTP
jgi:hypothetical protein